MMALRECGDRHLGVCWTERFNRWWPDKAPKDEYPRREDWARLGADGWQPRRCQGRFYLSRGGVHPPDPRPADADKPPPPPPLACGKCGKATCAGGCDD